LPRSSYRKLDKDYRRRELYSSIYSEMSEVIDASAESENLRSGGGGDAGGGLDEDEELEDQQSFPQLIATQETTQATMMSSTGRTNPTPSETSSNGNRNKYRLLADALFLEAQEVERQGERRVGYSSVSELSIDSSSSQGTGAAPGPAGPGGGYIIVRGDGKATDLSNGTPSSSTGAGLGAEEDFDPDIDSLFLTQEEQKKK
jgi:hypothetical protein